MRFNIARPRECASPHKYQGVTCSRNSTSGRRRRTRSKAVCATWARSVSCNSVSAASSRAKSTRSPIRVESSSICAITSCSRAFFSSSEIWGAPGFCSNMSSSMLVRMEVSGVFSSCPASATSCACRCRDWSRAANIWLKLMVSRANSSLPTTGMGVSFWVRVTASTADWSRTSGFRPAVATTMPVMMASSTPKPPNTKRARPKVRMRP